MQLAKITVYVPCFKMQEHVYMAYGNQISEFFQFICLGSLAFLFMLLCIKERKHANICLFSNSP